MSADLEQALNAADAEYGLDDDLLRALARSEGGTNAFPEDLLERGRQIFNAITSAVGDGLCRDADVAALIESNGPRTSEALTIVPLLLNLLPEQALKDESVILVALLVARMGLREFCRHRTPR